MASRPDERLWSAAWLGVIVLGFVACSSDDVVKLETLELADGEFYGLSWGGTQVERFHVVARPGPRGETDPNALVLVSPQRDEPCDLGTVQRFYTQQPRSGSKYVLGSPSPARLALFDGIDDHGFGTLSFADIDCKRTDLTVPDLDAGTLLRIYPPDLEQLLLGVQDRDRNVLLVDPWHDDVQEVAKDVDNVWLTENAAWFIESKQLVRRDFTGRERRRLGTDVSGFLSMGGEDFAYVDQNNLIVERAGKSMQVATDACGPRALDSFIPGAISFFSPCETRRLVVQPAIGRSVDYEPNVMAYSAQQGRLFLSYDNDERTQTTLYTAEARQADKVSVWAVLPHIGIGSIQPIRGGRWLVQGNNDTGTLELWRLTDSVPSADPVSVVSGADAISQAGRAIAWLHEGELTMRDQNADATLLRVQDVSRFNFVFPGSSSAIVYLSQVDRATGLGRLDLQFVTSAEQFALARDVREYREVWWPERGVLYARGGSRAGIRFARVDIPCEMTSDSPWACGF